MTLAVELPNNHTSSFTCWIFKVLVEVINFSHNFQAFVVQNAVKICHEFNAWLVKNERFVFPQTKSYKYFIILLQLNTIVYLARLDVLRQKQTASWHRFLGSPIQINSKQRFNGFILPVRKKERRPCGSSTVRLGLPPILGQGGIVVVPGPDVTRRAVLPTLAAGSRPHHTFPQCCHYRYVLLVLLYCHKQQYIKKIKVSTLRFIINLYILLILSCKKNYEIKICRQWTRIFGKSQDDEKCLILI